MSGLQSILNNKLLIKVEDRKCIPVTTTTATTTTMVSDNTSHYYYATPLQASLLVGNIKTTKLLLSLGGISVISDYDNHDNNINNSNIDTTNTNNNIINISDAEALRIGGNITCKKLINEFIKQKKK
jgi:hypothetical protein